VTFIGINIYRLRDSKIVERWSFKDYAIVFRQLGASPA
jgi:predicted ester cyclase